MGYLKLDKLNTLELFLTDKGKELMLRENALGLADLIVQFSADDSDYDYRRTSSVWVDGISPQGPGPGGWYPNPYGSTESTSNQNGGPQWFDELGSNNPCRSCNGPGCTPLSGDCWYDMPDVRGSRGRTVKNCFPVTGETSGLTNCTNIYAFYDATSVFLQDAQAAKVGLSQWFSGVTASTITTENPHGSYTGKLFHIPVFGERWLNTSYYPWHGELDTVDYNGLGNQLNGLAINGSFGGLKDRNGFSATAGVTGLYLHVDNSQSTGDWEDFQVLPPGAIGESGNGGQGRRAEFYATGCTKNNSINCYFSTGGIATGVESPTDNQVSIPCDAEILETYTFDIIFSATNNTTVWRIDTPGWGAGASTWTSSPYIHKYGWWDYHTNLLSNLSLYVNDSVTFFDITGKTEVGSYNMPANTSTISWESDVGSGCKLNCCNTRENSGPFNYQLSGGTGGPLGDTVTGGTRLEGVSFGKEENSLENTGSQFGCMECSPFDNFVPYETGHTYTVQNLRAIDFFSEADGTITSLTGKTTLRAWNLLGPCRKYKGGDKNVMIVSIFDETSPMTCNENSWGGVFPLDFKNVYNGNGIGDYTLNNLEQFAPGATMPLASQKRRGYHSKGVYVTDPSTCPNPMNGPGCSGNAGYHGPYGCDGSAADNYPTNCEIVAGVHQNDWSAGGHPQPTIDYKYSQDLFMRTLPFYDSFMGFLYPVVKNISNARADFALHAYGAVMGNIVFPQDLIENPTVQTNGGTFSAITKSNPYSTVNPLLYDRPAVPFSPTSSPAWAGGQSLYPVTFLAPNIVTQGPQPVSTGLPGLTNYNWGVNLAVGCATNAPSAVGCSNCNLCCSSGDIFSGGTFNADLTEFIKGGAFKIITTTTGCTECQCLPAVFRNNKGPVVVIEDDGCPCPDGTLDPICCINPSGCPCPDGTYSPSCCGGDPGGPGESICGPISYGGTNSGGSSQQSGNGSMRNYPSSPTERRQGAPVSSESLRTNLNINQEVNFTATLHQFAYMENGEQRIDYDVEFNSTSTINGSLIKENDGVFYWKVDNGVESYDRNGNPATRPCSTLEWAALNQRYSARGAYPFVFLNSYRDSSPTNWSHNKEEYCITLGVHSNGQVMMINKRIRISGDNMYGWQLKMLT
tara:strand:- start:23154 stop:26561 length:3408 start_codon:yes stop_codon:yes gene_type:complete